MVELLLVFSPLIAFESLPLYFFFLYVSEHGLQFSVIFGILVDIPHFLVPVSLAVLLFIPLTGVAVVFWFFSLSHRMVAIFSSITICLVLLPNFLVLLGNGSLPREHQRLLRILGISLLLKTIKFILRLLFGATASQPYFLDLFLPRALFLALSGSYHTISAGLVHSLHYLLTPFFPKTQIGVDFLFL